MPRWEPVLTNAQRVAEMSTDKRTRDAEYRRREQQMRRDFGIHWKSGDPVEVEYEWRGVWRSKPLQGKYGNPGSYGVKKTFNRAFSASRRGSSPTPQPSTSAASTVPAAVGPSMSVASTVAAGPSMSVASTVAAGPSTSTASTQARPANSLTSSVHELDRHENMTDEVNSISLRRFPTKYRIYLEQRAYDGRQLRKWFESGGLVVPHTGSRLSVQRRQHLLNQMAQLGIPLPPP